RGQLPGASGHRRVNLDFLRFSGDPPHSAGHVGPGHGVVFAGPLLAQSIAASAQAGPDKRVKSLHTIFARGGSTDAPIQIGIDPMHTGRAFASTTVSVTQGARLCARSLVLLEADEPDLIRHEP